MIVFITDNIMVNSEELIGTTEYLLLSMRCCINCCHNNWVQLVCVCVVYGGKCMF